MHQHRRRLGGRDVQPARRAGEDERRAEDERRLEARVVHQPRRRRREEQERDRAPVVEPRDRAVVPPVVRDPRPKSGRNCPRRRLGGPRAATPGRGSTTAPARRRTRAPPPRRRRPAQERGAWTARRPSRCAWPTYDARGLARCGAGRRRSPRFNRRAVLATVFVTQDLVARAGTSAARGAHGATGGGAGEPAHVDRGVGGRRARVHHRRRPGAPLKRDEAEDDAEARRLPGRGDADAPTDEAVDCASTARCVCVRAPTRRGDFASR